eukprot:1144660-Pelagomonas_calceolata.AAC.3
MMTATTIKAPKPNLLSTPTQRKADASQRQKYAQVACRCVRSRCQCREHSRRACHCRPCSTIGCQPPHQTQAPGQQQQHGQPVEQELCAAATQREEYQGSGEFGAQACAYSTCIQSGFPIGCPWLENSKCGAAAIEQKPCATRAWDGQMQ